MSLKSHHVLRPGLCSITEILTIILPIKILTKQEFEGNRNVLMWMKTHFVSRKPLKYVERILNKNVFGYKYGLV